MAETSDVLRHVRCSKDDEQYCRRCARVFEAYRRTCGDKERRSGGRWFTLVTYERSNSTRVHKEELIVAMMAMDGQGVAWTHRELECEEPLGAGRCGVNLDVERR